MMLGKYTDANDYAKVKKQYRKVGLPSSHVTAVDKDYAFVPTNTSQAAKGSQSNVRKAHKMNMKRFGLE